MGLTDTIRIGIDLQATGPFIVRTLPGLTRFSRERPDVQFIAMKGQEISWTVHHLGIVGMLAHFTPQSFVQARDHGLQAVSILRSGDETIPTVTNDDRATGRLAGEHLLERRVQHAGFFFDGDKQVYSAGRLAGLREALEPAGYQRGRVPHRPKNPSAGQMDL